MVWGGAGGEQGVKGAYHKQDVCGSYTYMGTHWLQAWSGGGRGEGGGGAGAAAALDATSSSMSGLSATCVTCMAAGVGL